jgi:hypothetical protein
MADREPPHLPAELPAIRLPQPHMTADVDGQKPQIKRQMDLARPD